MEPNETQLQEITRLVDEGKYKTLEQRVAFGEEPGIVNGPGGRIVSEIGARD